MGNVSATDPDAEQRLRYSVTGGSGEGHFDVNPQTGQITVRAGVNLDFETSPQWSLLVLVRDDGDPSLSTTAEQTIRVDNEDEAPQFVSELSPPAVESGAMLEWSIPVDAVFDPEGDASVIEAEGLPPWLTFHPLTRAFTGIPSSFYTGASEFVLKATQVDAPDLSDSVTVTLTVTISDTPLHNLVVAHDVNGDKEVTANDALRIINYLAREGSDKLVDATFRFDGFFDVTGDNRVTSLDALRVINEMARRELSGSGEEITLGISNAEFDDSRIQDLGLRRYLDSAGLF